ncbi:MAG: sigma-54-dependent Fis family transcriptional regulator [Methylibium sp.]|uniref:sigma-54-dependent Fis family transcriptional regulator n=1 Tax=Methylibium sp. TaxID=2067992 RepID=UPI0017EBA705|nr:sigma-54-dependent Fis family transcriptional regulator [Methylibium sp.]MBA3598909.1 sigma-54-dependent Fis family transcriptional regulator [Methylibium sp.]
MATYPAARTAPRDARATGFGHVATSALLPPDPSHLEAIVQSHERCGSLGISPIQAPDHAPVVRADLAVARERNRRLSAHSVPVMEMLLEQILATQSMVLLTDVQGTVLHSIGHDDFLARAAKVALAPGVNWSEQNKGTNAIGTSLVTENPTLVHADEHFMHANHFLTCTAAPIFDPRGNVVGVLDVTGDHHSFHSHTMGLVKMSARMIQNHWLMEDSRQALRLHFHGRLEYLGTLMEGVVAVGPDGKLHGANRAALDHLGMSGAALRMNTLAALFGVTLATLVDHFSASLASPLALRLPDGRQVHATARFNWPGWYRLGSAGESDLPASAHAAVQVAVAGETPRNTAPAAPLSQLSLRQLQTGDPQMDAVVERVKRVLDRDIAVLIQGETGSGKEVLARAIHLASKRADGPFVAVNCASIPESLIESELFGCEERAITGARRKGAPGKVMQAHGGTLFLDEIGDMPLPLQARLLRVLQEREATPLDSNRAAVADVAVISATHRPLREMMDAQRFREDLYYRLNGLVLRLPPLRERSDLMVLADKLLKRECRGRLPRLDEEVLRLMQGYGWPGNIRQLATVLRTAAALVGDEGVIAVQHLSEDFLHDARRTVGPEGPASLPSSEAQPAAASGATPEPAGVPRTLQQLELDTVKRVLEEAGGNISVAARRLGVSRNTIYRRLYWPPGSGR